MTWVGTRTCQQINGLLVICLVYQQFEICAYVKQVALAVIPPFQYHLLQSGAVEEHILTERLDRARNVKLGQTCPFIKRHRVTLVIEFGMTTLRESYRR